MATKTALFTKLSHHCPNKHVSTIRAAHIALLSMRLQPMQATFRNGRHKQSPNQALQSVQTRVDQPPELTNRQATHPNPPLPSYGKRSIRTICRVTFRLAGKRKPNRKGHDTVHEPTLLINAIAAASLHLTTVLRLHEVGAIVHVGHDISS